MPGKSRRGKGKHPHHSKKSKAIMRQAGSQLRPQQAVATPEPAKTIESPAAPKAAAAPEAVTAPRYPYVTDELKRIGILAGIIIVILIILAIVL